MSTQADHRRRHPQEGERHPEHPNGNDIGYLHHLEELCEQPWTAGTERGRTATAKWLHDRIAYLNAHSDGDIC